MRMTRDALGCRQFAWDSGDYLSVIIVSFFKTAEWIELATWNRS